MNRADKDDYGCTKVYRNTHHNRNVMEQLEKLEEPGEGSTLSARIAYEMKVQSLRSTLLTDKRVQEIYMHIKSSLSVSDYDRVDENLKNATDEEIDWMLKMTKDRKTKIVVDILTRVYS
jgi:hypothetical protein